MEKVINFAKKYNIVDLIIIFSVSFLLFLLFYAKQDAYLIDVGREAYIPWQMIEGKVLYRDIFNVYGPLGYQINALAFLLFGVKLNTLYLMGFFNSVVITFVSYFITRLFASRRIAFCVIALTMSVCIFIRTFFNFIFAYSYSAVYALSGFLISLFFALLYLKDRKIQYLAFSFLAAGFSFANKIENLPYFCFLFLCLPFFVKDWKNCIKTAGLFFVFPVLSFGVLLLQGASFGDLLNAAELIQKMIKAPVTEYFYNAYGLYFNPLYIQYSFVILAKILKTALPCALLFYGLNFLNEKYIKNEFLKTVTNIFVAFLSIIIIAGNCKIVMTSGIKLFCWLGLCGIIVFLVLLGFGIFKAIKNKFDFSVFETRDKMFLFLLVSSILVSLKGISGITTECYGTFSLAVLFIPFVVFFVLYLPKIKFVDKTALEKTVQNLCFTLFAVFLLANLFKIAENPLYAVETPRGKIHVRESMKSQNEFIKFLKQNTQEDSSVIVVPEGAMINFLSERKSDGFYYYLIPVNVQIFGEDKIVSDFSKNMPDYFVMSNIPYTPYNVGTFCDYAPKICGFIKENYTPAAKVKDKVSFVLYKKNPVVK